MASSKQAMQTKPLRNDQEIIEFMSETDDELSDLSDSDFEDIMDATDVSSDEEFLSDMNDHNKILIYCWLLYQKNVLDQDQITLKKLRKVQINTKNYVAHRLNLRSPWEDIYLTDSHVSMFLFLLEIFELIVTDDIVDHIVTYSNLHANQSIGN